MIKRLEKQHTLIRIQLKKNEYMKPKKKIEKASGMYDDDMVVQCNIKNIMVIVWQTLLSFYCRRIGLKIILI